MRLADIIDIQGGGPGSGCQGENCGRPLGSQSHENPKSDGTDRHRVQVTISDPNHPMVTQRNARVMKTIKVRGKDRHEAVERAQKHYKKAGYKIHDTHYIGAAKRKGQGVQIHDRSGSFGL